MEEKPYEQLIIESLLKDVYTLSFAKVTKVDNGTSFLEVKNMRMKPLKKMPGMQKITR